MFTHRRGDGADGGIKVVGLAAEQDHVEAAANLALLDRFDGGSDLTVVTPDDQAIALQLGGPSWPNQESDIGASFQELSAKESTKGTGTKHKKSHCLSNGVTVRSAGSIDRAGIVASPARKEKAARRRPVRKTVVAAAV
jgi:hypothetical protein